MLLNTVFFHNFISTNKKNITFAVLFKGGDVAQLVEQRTENPCVTGSIPVVATASTSVDVLFFYPKFMIQDGFSDVLYLCEPECLVVLA